MDQFMFAFITRLFFIAGVVLIVLLVRASLATERENKRKHSEYESRRSNT